MRVLRMRHMPRRRQRSQFRDYYSVTRTGLMSLSIWQGSTKLYEGRVLPHIAAANWSTSLQGGFQGVALGTYPLSPEQPDWGC